MNIECYSSKSGAKVLKIETLVESNRTKQDAIVATNIKELRAKLEAGVTLTAIEQRQLFKFLLNRLTA